MRTTWTFHSASQLFFGENSTRHLSEVAMELRLTRVLLVTDPVLVAAGTVDPVLGALSEAGVNVELFIGGEPEPSLKAAYSAIGLGRDFRPDGVLGLGGGSNMDLAKITALILTHGGTPGMYFGDSRVPGPIMPLICMPTTAGTGSEVSAAAVLTDTENAIKVSTLSNHLRPGVAIVDPILSMTCPARVTADSGIDALTHAVEAYTAVDNERFPLPAGERSVYQGKNPMADLFAEKAISLVGRFLRRAVSNGQDLEAREGMALAGTLGGLAFSNAGVAVVHALEYPLGGAVHCSHGAGNGLLLPHVMRYNVPACPQVFAKIAALLGEDVTALGTEAAAERAVAAVAKLQADIGIPGRLRDMGVKPEQLDGFAEKAFALKRLMRVNPREVTLEGLQGILRAAL
jgi:alcohol dehydrogenase class IV